MNEVIDPVQRLSRDIASASITLSADEARFLVDSYYAMQEDRIRSNNQVRALSESEEPHDVLRWLAAQSETLENQIKRALTKYVEGHPVGEWLLSVHGIGPVIAAGLLAHIDMTPWRCKRKDDGKPACSETKPHEGCGRERLETAGHIWRFAGLDPTMKWEKGQKRPFNAKLKVICWKAGESFVKVSGNEDAMYGRFYIARKKLEWERNALGAFADQAKRTLEEKKFSRSTDALLWYSGCINSDGIKKYMETPVEDRVGLIKKIAGEKGSGIPMLPPAHIQARAKRYAVKLFLSHLHHTWYRIEFKEEPPKPYAIEHLGHAHWIKPEWREKEAAE